MDPSDDIIDLLYNKSSSEDLLNDQENSRKLQRQPSVTNYGFAYHHPPSRNYYEDLHQIQRRNFHGSDSIYQSKRPLCRTDSAAQNQVICLLSNNACHFFHPVRWLGWPYLVSTWLDTSYKSGCKVARVGFLGHWYWNLASNLKIASRHLLLQRKLLEHKKWHWNTSS